VIGILSRAQYLVALAIGPMVLTNAISMRFGREVHVAFQSGLLEHGQLATVLVGLAFGNGQFGVLQGMVASVLDQSIISNAMRLQAANGRLEIGKHVARGVELV